MLRGFCRSKEDGVRCYAPNGDLIGKIHMPETVANLTFGGMRHNRLYILWLDVALCVPRDCARRHEASIWRRGAGLSGRGLFLCWPGVGFFHVWVAMEKSAVSRLAA